MRDAHPVPSGTSPMLRAVRLSVATVLLSAAVVWLGGQGDLLALPAVTLAVGSWLVLTTAWLVGHLLTEVGPRVVEVGARLLPAAWRAAVRVPGGAPLARAAARVRPAVRELAPAGRWLAARLAPTRQGLGRTLPVAVIATSVTLLVVGAHAIHGDPGMVPAVDARYADLAGQLRTSTVVRWAVALSNVGRVPGLLAMTAALALGAIAARAWRGALLLVATGLVSSAAVTVLKAWVGRPRPPVGRLVETSSAWPSGHAAGGLALAAGVCLLTWAAGVRRWHWVAAVVVPVGLLVGYTRAYLTVHWLSDVAAGWLVAATATATVVLVVNLLDDRLPASWSDRPVRHAPLAAAAVVALVVATVRGIGGSDDAVPTPPAPEPTPVPGVGAVVDDLAVDPWSRTLLGRRLPPVAIVVVGDRAAIDAGASAAGWQVADRATLPRLVASYRAGGPAADPTAPLSPSFVDERMQDLSLVRPTTEDGAAARATARLWRLPVVLPDGCGVWVATAALEDHIRWSWGTLVPSHGIAAAIDGSRARLVEDLTATGDLARTGRRRLLEPTFGTTASGDPFFTDGTAVVLRQASGCSAD